MDSNDVLTSSGLHRPRCGQIDGGWGTEQACREYRDRPQYRWGALEVGLRGVVETRRSYCDQCTPRSATDLSGGVRRLYLRRIRWQEDRRLVQVEIHFDGGDHFPRLAAQKAGA